MAVEVAQDTTAAKGAMDVIKDAWPIVSSIVLAAITIVVRAINWSNTKGRIGAGHFSPTDLQQARRRFIPVHLVGQPQLTGGIFSKERLAYTDLISTMASGEGTFPQIVLVLGGTGIGKTTLLLRLYLRSQNIFRRYYELLFGGEGRYNVVAFHLASTQSLKDIRKMNDDRAASGRTILLCDGLDEMDGNGRMPFIELFDHLRYITGNFRGVVLTCRNQFASAEDLKHTARRSFKVVQELSKPEQREVFQDPREVGVFSVPSFTAPEIRAYLDRIFPWYTFQVQKRERAEELLLTSGAVTDQLGIPLVLAYLEEIITHKDYSFIRFSSSRILEGIIGNWIDREVRKVDGEEQKNLLKNGLWRFSEQLGYELVTRNVSAYTYDELVVSPALRAYFKDAPVKKLRLKPSNSSLLNRVYGTSASEPERWSFAHRVFRDLFAARYAKHCWENPAERVKAVERDFFHARLAEKFFKEMCLPNSPPSMAAMLVEGGTVQLGQTEKEKRYLDAHVHQPILEYYKSIERCFEPVAKQCTGFHMSIAPVTVAQYRRFVEAMGEDRMKAIHHGSSFASGDWNLPFADEKDTLRPEHAIGAIQLHANADHTWGVWEERGRIRGLPGGPEDQHPVVHVSLEETLHYCNWLSREAGLEECYSFEGATARWIRERNGYRLPTAAEWEYAAKGGKQQRDLIYSGSDDPLQVANTALCRGFVPDHVSTMPELQRLGCNTSNVRSLMANTIGLYDMSGNVSEWVWGLLYGRAMDEPDAEPEELSLIQERIWTTQDSENPRLIWNSIRGGCATDAHPILSNQSGSFGAGGYALTGFRVVRNEAGPKAAIEA